MRRLFIILFGLIQLVSSHVNAQDKTILAKSEYMAAEEAYSNGDFTNCLAHLKKSREYFGGSNYLLQYLEVKALYGDGRLLSASNAIDIFFKTNPIDNGSPQYSEMTKLTMAIKSDLSELEKAYQDALSSKNRITVEAFLKKYPNANQEYNNTLTAILIEINSNEKRLAFERFRTQSDSEYDEYVRQRRRKRINNGIGALSIVALPIGLKIAIQDKNYIVGVPVAVVGFYLPINSFYRAGLNRYSANKKYTSYSKLVDDANALGYQKLTKKSR